MCITEQENHTENTNQKDGMNDFLLKYTQILYKWTFLNQYMKSDTQKLIRFLGAALGGYLIYKGVRTLVETGSPVASVKETVKAAVELPEKTIEKAKDVTEEVVEALSLKDFKKKYKDVKFKLKRAWD